MTNILLIGQDEAQRAAVRQAIARRGDHIHELERPTDANVDLALNPPDFALLDARTGGAALVDATRAVAALSTLPLLALCDAGTPPPAEADICLYEPFDARDLIAAVSALLGTRAALVRLRQQNVALRARAEEAERNSETIAQSDREKDEFISFIAHELKNPMASIKGYADLMRRRLSKVPDDPNLKGLNIISQQVVRMTGLLDQLLDFSRINTNRLQLNVRLTDLSQLTRHVADELGASSDQHHLQLELTDDMLIANVDSIRLSQALGQVLTNAARYSPGGSTILVRAARVGGEPHAEALLSVTDSGIGVPAEEQQHLFQRFFRASNARETASGLGLGLFIARTIVERHGGSIEFVSAAGRGSTFSIRLPLVTEGGR